MTVGQASNLSIQFKDRLEASPTGRTTNTWDYEKKLILAVSPLLARVTCVYNPIGTRAGQSHVDPAYWSNHCMRVILVKGGKWFCLESTKE